jgi:hypothetical protein
MGLPGSVASPSQEMSRRNLKHALQKTRGARYGTDLHSNLRDHDTFARTPDGCRVESLGRRRVGVAVLQKACVYAIRDMC